MASELKSVDIEQLLSGFLFLYYFFFLALFGVLIVQVLSIFNLFLFLFLLACSHVFQNGRVLQNISGKPVLVVQLPCEWTGVALSCNDVVDYDHVHFGEFAFRAANVLLDKLIQHFKHFGV